MATKKRETMVGLAMLREDYLAAKNALASVIVGQGLTIDRLFVALFADGHLLLEGTPGLGKTLLVHAFAKVAGLEFSRVQFTPDLMPQDIIGGEILDEGPNGKAFRFVEGPVFTNVLLADEINRTPPKTQSALLEAMQERRVTSYGKTYSLPSPFIVMATQNPIEHEGTYPLPEAQLDRFLFYVRMEYPSQEEERVIATKAGFDDLALLAPVFTQKKLLAYRAEAKEIPVAESVLAYAVDVVRNTRPESSSSKAICDFVAYGAGPRASQYLIRAAKAYAALMGRVAVTKEEIDWALEPTLAHRVILNFRAKAEGYSFADVYRWVREATE